MDTDRTASADPLDAPVGFLTPELRADLLRRWNEPPRRYHNETHLRAVLQAIDALEVQRLRDDFVGEPAAIFHLSVIADASQQSVRDSRRATRSTVKSILKSSIAG